MKSLISKLILIIFLLSIAKINYAQSYYPDVCRYEIHLNDINHSTKNINANTFVKFTVHSAIVTQIDLSLEQFIIDSILQNGQSLSYTYNDTLLKINLN